MSTSKRSAVEALIPNADIRFENRVAFERRETIYNGRNGEGRCVGIDITRKGKDLVYIQPVTSRGKTSDACRITIPFEEIDNVIESLERMKGRQEAQEQFSRSARKRDLI